MINDTEATESTALGHTGQDGEASPTPATMSQALVTFPGSEAGESRSHEPQTRVVLSIAPASSANPLRRMVAAPAFGALPQQERVSVRARLAAMLRIDAAPRKDTAIELEARRPIAGRCYSKGAVHKLYYDRWRKSSRDWQSLINRAIAPKVQRGLAPETVICWHQYCDRFMGRMNAAWRQLERDWRAGKDIPGIDAALPRYELPAGLSYSNLVTRKYVPRKATRAIARVGVSAAAPFLPALLTTRVGVAPGAYYEFDDLWHDFSVTVPGQIGARRLLQFHAIELLSGCQIARGMRPEVLNDQTGRMERLKVAESRFLLVHVLGNLGWNGETGTTCIMEKGTTTVSEREERILYDYSGGLIKINRGRVTSAALAEGLYAGRGKGNFKIKAALESLGSLVHNETGDRLLLPFQNGSNERLNKPDEAHGREKHLVQIQELALSLPVEVRDLFTHEITPPLVRAIELVDMIQERMNQRTRHEIEGYERCGFVRALFRMSPEAPWQPQTLLNTYPPAVREAMAAALAADPRLARARLMSPREVFDERVAPHLTRLPMHLVPQLLGMELAKERKVAKDGRFHFDDEDLGAGEHHYEAVAHDEAGGARELLPGEKFATFASTLDPQRLHLCDARGQYVGWVERTLVPTKSDAEGFGRAAGQQMAARGRVLAEAHRASRPLIERQLSASANAQGLLATAAMGELGQRRSVAPPAGTRKTQSKNADRMRQLAAQSREGMEALNAL